MSETDPSGAIENASDPSASEGALEGETHRINLNQPDWPAWKAKLGLYPSLETQQQSEEPEDGEDQPEEGDEQDQPEGNGDPDKPGFDDGDDPDDPDLDDDGEEIGNEFGETNERFYLPIHVPPKVPLDPFDQRNFSSWTEFVNCATNDDLYAWKNSGKRSSHNEDGRYGRGWSGTKTWDEAIEMATKRGWPEGRKLLYEALAIARPRPEPFRSIEMSVAGAFPMVPNYCAGDPECMVVDPGSDLRHTKPIIRIDYNHWISAGVRPEDMIIRGAAVLSLAETLERYGYSTELRIIGNSNVRNRTFRYSVVFKQAGEILDIDRAAFAIAHPSSMRRLAFAILEQHPELERDFKEGYGYPQREANDPDPNTIFIPGTTGGETPEKAKLVVEQAASGLLSELQRIEAGD